MGLPVVDVVIFAGHAVPGVVDTGSAMAQGSIHDVLLHQTEPQGSSGLSPFDGGLEISPPPALLGAFSCIPFAHISGIGFFMYASGSLDVDRTTRVQRSPPRRSEVELQTMIAPSSAYARVCLPFLVQASKM